MRVTLAEPGRAAAAAFHKETGVELDRLLAPLATQDRELFRTSAARIVAAHRRH